MKAARKPGAKPPRPDDTAKASRGASVDSLLLVALGAALGALEIEDPACYRAVEGVLSSARSKNHAAARAKAKQRLLAWCKTWTPTPASFTVVLAICHALAGQDEG